MFSKKCVSCAAEGKYFQRQGRLKLVFKFKENGDYYKVFAFHLECHMDQTGDH